MVRHVQMKLMTLIVLLQEQTIMKCAQCNNATLCNTEEFFDNAKFCWEKSNNSFKPVSALRECGSQCYVSRDKDGKGLKENKYKIQRKSLVKQGCKICPENDNSTVCINCDTKHCNEERLVPKQCWGNSGTTCKTTFETPCFVERTANNTGIETKYLE
uniref:Secreted protein n=1 Tax=Meloidogyne hapla TaxID=6305 RepID=A0A1I8B870_MELHA